MAAQRSPEAVRFQGFSASGMEEAAIARYEIKVARLTRPRSARELRAEWERAQGYGKLPSSERHYADVQRPGYWVREVRHDTSYQARRAVHQHAVYLSRENGWRVQYPVKTDARARAFLWIDTAPGNAGLGSVCFYPRRGRDGSADWWGLQWAWFHPYVRGKGFLGEVWPYFRSRFGDFDVEAPLSAGMRGFLERRGGNPSQAAKPRRSVVLDVPFSVA